MSYQSWQAEQYCSYASFVSELGSSVISLLNPALGENILDLGCGDGILTEKIAQVGANVVGIDSSSSMVEATLNRGVTAYSMSGEKLSFQNQFDAVFSNAALHWMKDYNSVINGVQQALKPSGRFVGELEGGGILLH